MRSGSLLIGEAFSEFCLRRRSRVVKQYLVFDVMLIIHCS